MLVVRAINSNGLGVVPTLRRTANANRERRRGAGGRPSLRYGVMDEAEKKRRARERVTDRLRSFYAELRERCADVEEFFRRITQRRKPPEDPSCAVGGGSCNDRTGSAATG